MTDDDLGFTDDDPRFPPPPRRKPPPILAIASATLGKRGIRSSSLRLQIAISPFAIAVMARKPSYLSSYAQSRSLAGGSPTSVASIGGKTWRRSCCGVRVIVTAAASPAPEGCALRRSLHRATVARGASSFGRSRYPARATSPPAR